MWKGLFVTNSSKIKPSIWPYAKDAIYFVVDKYQGREYLIRNFAESAERIEI